MAIFADYHRSFFIFTSYKVAFSTLKSQKDLTYLNYKLDFSIIKHIIKHFNFKRYLIVRDPYERICSLFSDKYRKQPERILRGEHE